MARKSELFSPHGAPLRLSRAGIVIGNVTVPLLAGSVHYFHLDPRDWRPALQALVDMGLRLVDTYVPWAVHERKAGGFDFGSENPRLDLVAFLRLAQELGLYAIVRPGPHINAELTYFGIPERVIWDPECQARSAHGKPVALPVPPLAFPVPSYASRAFLREANEWLRASAEQYAPWCYPRGPVVLCQVDNEGAMYFRDGVYDQDYHPDAVKHYRKFLNRKYDSPEELSVALGFTVNNFEIEPPRQFDAATTQELSRHLDWAEAQEALLATSFGKLKETLIDAGVNVPFSHNFPPGESMSPLDPSRVQRVVDLVGLDYYHLATPAQRAEIARRTTDLAVRAEKEDVPTFACELGAGFPPFFPPLSEGDNQFTVLTALAYGLRGYNLYMAVERDRWIGAPYDQHGVARPSAEFWRKLSLALERLHFNELVRHAPVHLVIPRSMRRLHRVLHAFGPLSAVMFQIMGRGAIDAQLEDELDWGGPFALNAERFVRWFEEELEQRRIPFAMVGGDLIEASIENASWTIVACTGGLEREIVKACARGLKAGASISIGPHFPQRDEALIPREPPGALRHAFAHPLPTMLDFDEQRLRHTIELACEHLSLRALTATPSEIAVTVHHDREGTPRALFVINPTDDLHEASVGCFGCERAEDALDGSIFHASFGSFQLPLPARSVRLLALESPSHVARDQSAHAGAA